MRIWPASASATTVPPRSDTPRDLAVQIDEGFIVARSALRLAVKNGIIMRILRDGDAWDDAAATELARQAVFALVQELGSTAARLSDDIARAPAPARSALGARSKRELARIRRELDEAERLSARTRTLRGVVEQLEAAHDDEQFIRELAVRARDDMLSELMQARLIPRAQPTLLTTDEQREAIDGVKADLRQLLDERAGY